MIRIRVLTSLAVSALAAGTIAAQAAPPRPKITAGRAETIAARALHGKAVKATYEFEDGRWQYAVIVMRGKAMYEVEVNSTSGKVLDQERTSAREEAQEAAADQKAAMKAHHTHSARR